MPLFLVLVVTLASIIFLTSVGRVCLALNIIDLSAEPNSQVASSIITTIAGTGTSGYNGDNGLAIHAQLGYPNAVSADMAGNIFIADYPNHRIRKVVLSSGIITTVAGNGFAGYSGDGGVATSAQLFEPRGLSVDSFGNLYIADTMNHCIRKVNVSSGVIITVAGIGVAGFGGDDGDATNAYLYYPSSITMDKGGSIYIADYYNLRIRKLDTSTGIITTVAGTGIAAHSGDNGDARNAQLFYPYGVSVDETGNVYIAEYFGHRIRKINVSSGIITTVAGVGTAGDSGDGGDAKSAQLYYPIGVDVDLFGNIYIVDSFNSRIRKVIASSGMITTIAGNGYTGYKGDGGAASESQLHYPIGVEVDSSGIIYIADGSNYCVRRIGPIVPTAEPSASPTTQFRPSSLPSSQPSRHPSRQPTRQPTSDPTISRNTTTAEPPAHSSGIITTYAGTGNGGDLGDNGPATSASFNNPRSVTSDTLGNIYIADQNNVRIRKVDTYGLVTTIAGTGVVGYGGDNGPATSALLRMPTGAHVDSFGNLYISDGNCRIRKIVLSTGIITTVAGTGEMGGSGDNGLAINAQLFFPSAVTTDKSGNVYIADRFNYRIRKIVLSTGIITSVAGSGIEGSSGDNGPATIATLGAPAGVYVDTEGNIYIALRENNCIRKVDVNGIITTLAGTGTFGYSGNNGPAISAELGFPSSVTGDSLGNIIITDQSNRRIRKIDKSGIITTIAGNGDPNSYYSGDGGPALSASLGSPDGVTVDAYGNIYFGDAGRIRKITPEPSKSPTASPTWNPSISPSNIPTKAPSAYPKSSSPFVTTKPSIAPSSSRPTIAPSLRKSSRPTKRSPSASPTKKKAPKPTASPSKKKKPKSS